MEGGGGLRVGGHGSPWLQGENDPEEAQKATRLYAFREQGVKARLLDHGSGREHCYVRLRGVE